ncbi:Protein CBR-SRE-27 [Caenorhabditis briggsae]|uniref:Protein CBR-SRE-27 n=1 Tax=Caenorhabditis briggsae TaxID=6238 RepID=A8XZ18_CAEBR|nr:Protein CBR-SRE-27 [Caenorhabditis briggsae]CAP37885.1 Protein CBR-SRE-27 [Caenorhabditis briggsae]
MIIKIINPSNDPYFICLPVYFYTESDSIAKLISFIELILYTFCFYTLSIKLQIYLKFRIFHRNFVILSVPIFGLWYEAILAKLITMAYQLKFLSPGYEIGEHVAMWTQNPKKMLILNSLDGLELLLVAGFLEWHYIFSMIFGSLSVCIERVLASMWIKHYEKNKKLYIPISLTLVTQCLTIAVSFTMFYNHVNIIAANLIWIITCILASIMYFYIKRINEKWLAEMEDPRRKITFTVSQRFQVRENLRAIGFGKRIVYTVMFSLAVIGFGILALFYEIVSPFLLHIGENLMFWNPFGICTVAMFSIPAWKKRYKNAFPTCCQWRLRPSRVDVESMEPMEEFNKRISIETDMYFNQLNESWI